mgnify:FL=1|tara:strand:- start:132 stop:356 length:225 start_codon:yes stop_codon:yes gene_type:complete
MKTEQHREEVIKYLTKLNERQITIFHRVSRIEKHLDTLNGKTNNNNVEIAKIKTWGGVALFAIPILINLLMKAI